MSRVDDLKAELDLAVLEDELAQAKADEKLKPDKYRALKDKVRAARQAHREARETPEAMEAETMAFHNGEGAA